MFGDGLRCLSKLVKCQAAGHTFAHRYVQYFELYRLFAFFRRSLLGAWEDAGWEQSKHLDLPAESGPVRRSAGDAGVGHQGLLSVQLLQEGRSQDGNFPQTS